MAYIYHGCLALRLHMKLATTTVRRIQAPHRQAHQSWLAIRAAVLPSAFEYGSMQRRSTASFRRAVWIFIIGRSIQLDTVGEFHDQRYQQIRRLTVASR